jgi:hypothetical protein
LVNWNVHWNWEAPICVTVVTNWSFCVVPVDVNSLANVPGPPSWAFAGCASARDRTPAIEKNAPILNDIVPRTSIARDTRPALLARRFFLILFLLADLIRVQWSVDSRQ